MHSLCQQQMQTDGLSWEQNILTSQLTYKEGGEKIPLLIWNWTSKGTRLQIDIHTHTLLPFLHNLSLLRLPTTCTSSLTLVHVPMVWWHHQESAHLFQPGKAAQTGGFPDKNKAACVTQKLSLHISHCKTSHWIYCLQSNWQAGITAFPKIKKKKKGGSIRKKVAWPFPPSSSSRLLSSVCVTSSPS